jgi:hypothetical protein
MTHSRVADVEPRKIEIRTPRRQREFGIEQILFLAIIHSDLLLPWDSGHLIVVKPSVNTHTWNFNLSDSVTTIGLRKIASSSPESNLPTTIALLQPAVPATQSPVALRQIFPHVPRQHAMSEQTDPRQLPFRHADRPADAVFAFAFLQFGRYDRAPAVTGHRCVRSVGRTSPSLSPELQIVE